MKTRFGVDDRLLFDSVWDGNRLILIQNQVKKLRIDHQIGQFIDSFWFVEVVEVHIDIGIRW